MSAIESAEEQRIIFTIVIHKELIKMHERCARGRGRSVYLHD